MSDDTTDRDTDLEIFRVPAATSRGTRDLSARSKGSSRARLVGNEVPTEIRVESGLERKAAFYLLARQDVVDVQEQPTAVAYVDDNDVERHHTFDFKVSMRCGARVFIEIKPDKIADRKGLSGKLRAIATQVPRETADRVVHFGEDILRRDVVQNAMLIHSVRRDRDRSADEVVRSFMAKVNGAVSVADVVRATGLKSRGFRALVRLVAAGELQFVGPGRIDYSTMIARGPATCGGRR